MSRTVHLHVGTAKSGTTWLQQVMAQNRKLLARNDYLYPGKRNSHFLASLSLRDTSFKGHSYAGAVGEWDRIAAEVNGFRGQALVSHETMANARSSHIRRAVDSLDGEVRVLITVRDLGRQLPAAWQERVKNRNEQPYEEFLTRVREAWDEGNTGHGSILWRGQELVALARRWAKAVGTERVTFVTVPPPGAEPDELWHRFSRAAAMPPIEADLEVRSANTSLGTVEAELLRRLNGYLDADLPWPKYERLVKHRLVKDELALHEVGGKFTVPEEHREWVDAAADTMISGLREDGYPVVGDLEDLRPRYRSGATRPADVDADQLLEAALHALSSTALRPPQTKRRGGGGGGADVAGPGVREAAALLGRAVRQRLGR